MKILLFLIAILLTLFTSVSAEDFTPDSFSLEELHRINSLSGLKEAGVYNFSYSEVSESETIPELNYNKGGNYIIGGDAPIFFGLSNPTEGDDLSMEYYFQDKTHPAGYYSYYTGYRTVTLLPDAVYEREINASWPIRMNAYEESFKSSFESEGMLHMISKCSIPDFAYSYEIEYTVFPENGMIASMKTSFYEGDSADPYSVVQTEVFYNKPYAEFSPDDVLSVSSSPTTITVIMDRGQENETTRSFQLDPGVFLGYDYDSGTFCQDNECRRTQDYVEIIEGEMTVYGKSFQQ